MTPSTDGNRPERPAASQERPAAIRTAWDRTAGARRLFAAGLGPFVLLFALIGGALALGPVRDAPAAGNRTAPRTARCVGRSARGGRRPRPARPG